MRHPATDEKPWLEISHVHVFATFGAVDEAQLQGEAVEVLALIGDLPLDFDLRCRIAKLLQ